MRRRVPPVGFSHEEPPPELVRFATRASSPRWTAADFAAWLRVRAAWRDTHANPLPGLPARERLALSNLELPVALVDAEKAAPKAEPEWVARGEARRSSSGRGIGRLPEVARPVDTHGGMAQGGAE